METLENLCVAAVVITVFYAVLHKGLLNEIFRWKRKIFLEWFQIYLSHTRTEYLVKFLWWSFISKILTSLIIFANKLHHRYFTRSYIGSLLKDLNLYWWYKEVFTNWSHLRSLTVPLTKKLLEKIEKFNKSRFNKPKKFKSVSFEILEFFSSVHHKVSMSKKAFLEGEILIKLAISDFENSWLKVVKLFDCSKGTTIRQPLFIFFKFSTKYLTGKWTNPGETSFLQ